MGVKGWDAHACPRPICKEAQYVNHLRWDCFYSETLRMMPNVFFRVAGKGAFLRHARSSSLRVSIAGHACGVRSMSSLLAPRSTQSSHCLRTSHPSRPSVASTSITHQRRSLFIATASTPNPKSLKFTPTGKTLLDEGQTENFGDWDSGALIQYVVLFVA